MHHVLFYLFLAYTCSLPISIAGMELFFGIHIAFTLILLLFRKIRLSAFSHTGLINLFWSTIILGGLYVGLIFLSLAKHPEQSLISETLIIARDAKFFFVFAWSLLITAVLGRRFRNSHFRIFPILVTLIALYGICQALTPLDLFPFFRHSGEPLIIHRHFGDHHVLATIGTFAYHLTYGNIFMLYFVLLLLGTIHLYKTQQPLVNPASSVIPASPSVIPAPDRCRGQAPAGTHTDSAADVNRTYKLLLLSAFIVAISLITTYSRNVWIGLCILTVSMCLVYVRRKALPLLLICAILFGGFVSFHPLARDFVMRAFDPATDYQGFGQRIRNWKVQWQMFLDYPLLGIGHNQNERFYDQYKEKYYPEHSELTDVGGHAHNTFLQILVADGILGFLIWTAFAILLIRFLLRHRTHSPWYGTPAGLWLLLAFFIAGLTENALGDAEVSHNLFALLGMAAAFSVTQNSEA